MVRAIPLIAQLVVSVILAAFAPGSQAGDTRESRSASAAHPVLRGADISWSNCPKGEGIPSRRSKGEPMPRRSARFVVVGVTNGPGFFPNPCLADQLAWVDAHHRRLGAYAMTTYPTKAERKAYRKAGPWGLSRGHGALRNAGYAEAMFNLRVMHAVGMRARMIWVDVEPYPASPWSKRPASNRAVIAGVLRAYRDHGLRTGIYTYANGWHHVVGDWRLPRHPTWTTVGPRGSKAAQQSCTRGPSGGPAWLAQWYDTKRDYDLVCPVGRRHSKTLFRSTTKEFG